MEPVPQSAVTNVIVIVRSVFDCQSPLSTLSPSFSQFQFRYAKTIPVSVVISGCFFVSSQSFWRTPRNRLWFELGRDWPGFTLCSTSIRDAHILLSDETCLAFLSSPFSAVRPCGPVSFLLTITFLSHTTCNRLFSLVTHQLRESQDPVLDLWISSSI